MTPRERVIEAINFRQPDMPPIDFGGHRSSSVSAIAYARLRKHLKLEERPIRVYDIPQQLAIVDEDILDLFGIDTVEMGRGFMTCDKDWKDWTLPDGTPCQIPHYINVEKHGADWLLLADDGTQFGIQKEGCLYFEQTYFPMMDRDFEHDDFTDLPEIVGRTIWTGVPHPGAHLKLEGEELKQLAAGAAALRASTDRAIIGLFGGNMFEIPHWLFRMDNYFMYMGLYPESILRFSERLAAIHLENLEKWLGAAGPHIDIILFGDDLGGQNGPMISPASYRRLIKPFHSKLWNRAKQLADVKVMLHCCGSIRALLPDLIEAGLDIINPIQLTCAGNDAAALKKDFGRDIVLWGGGCDTQDVLPGGSPAEVAAHVRKQVAIMNPGGGFVFQQVHNTQADVPPENIEAMLRAVRS